MAYKFERAENKTLQIEIGKETYAITVGGMEAYRRYLNALERFGDAQKKLEQMTENGIKANDEILQLLGDTVLLIFNTVFGESIADKFVEFYENNYDEMLEQVLPWIEQEWLPAVKVKAKADSRRRAGLEAK